MANVKISALPAASTPLVGTEVLPIVQSGVTTKVSVANLTAGRAITASTITDSALTSGRVTYAGTGGILQDSVSLLFDGTTLTANVLNLNSALGIAYGGTGQTTANAAFNALVPSQTSNSGKFLTTDGTNTSWSTNPLGTVTSVAALTLGTTGTDLSSTVANSTTTPVITLNVPTASASNRGALSAADWSTFNGKGSVSSVAMTVPTFLSVTGSPITTSGTLAVTLSGTALPILNGGTGQTTATAAFNALSPITSTGDLILGNGANSATRLGIGTNGQVLQSNGTTASWVTFTGGATITPTTTNTTYYLVGTSSTSGTFSTASISSTTPISYNPSTGSLTSPVHISSNGLSVNSNTVSTSYSIPASNNAMSVGPITVASGQSVTVPSGSRWVVL